MNNFKIIFNDGTSKTCRKGINCHYEEYWLNHIDENHRDCGPAIIRYDKNDKIIQQHFYKNGLLHNDFGPAIIVYDTNGNIIEEMYFVNDKLHRIDGPAHIIYVNNILNMKKYSYDGKYFESLKELQNYNKTLILS